MTKKSTSERIRWDETRGYELESVLPSRLRPSAAVGNCTLANILVNTNPKTFWYNMHSETVIALPGILHEPESVGWVASIDASTIQMKNHLDKIFAPV